MQIVGLSVELWLVLIIFLTCWPFAPFAPFLFSMVNIAVVVIVNSKVTSALDITLSDCFAVRQALCACSS